MAVTVAQIANEGQGVVQTGITRRLVAVGVVGRGVGSDSRGGWLLAHHDGSFRGDGWGNALAFFKGAC